MEELFLVFRELLEEVQKVRSFDVKKLRKLLTSDATHPGKASEKRQLPERPSLMDSVDRIVLSIAVF